MIDFRSILTEDYRLPEAKADRVVEWIGSRPQVEQSVLLGRLAGWSLRMIAADLGRSHTWVSNVLQTWGDLRDIVSEEN